MQNNNQPNQLSSGQPFGILFITSYPPRECGIATYSQDLIYSIENKFLQSFTIKVCALETNYETFQYNEKVCWILDTSDSKSFNKIAEKINLDTHLKMVVIQHEFGLFASPGKNDFLHFLILLNKPVIIVFHTVIPNPDDSLKVKVGNIAKACKSIIVMTNNSKGILEQDYNIPGDKIEVIAHGTHLVLNNNKAFLKEKYGLTGHLVLSTFGLISSGKGIETTLEALPAIITKHKKVIFLIIGKTHPGVIKSEGEKYRRMLEEKVRNLKIEKHVKFINEYLELPVLLEYLRLTDLYLFTSTDPNQAVSGTFSYAMSCGCPIISTPIPQAREMLDENTGIIIDFKNSKQLAKGAIYLLNDDELRKRISLNTLHKIVPSAWENSAISHALLFKKTLGLNFSLQYELPPINLSHITQLTTDFGILQFAKINRPDLESGYTLDDNARALIALCMHYDLKQAESDLFLIKKYIRFIDYCIQPDGKFLNYINKKKIFTSQNNETNLEDANGRAVWALGFVISLTDILPDEIIADAEKTLNKSLSKLSKIHSTRAMAFIIKGLFLSQKKCKQPKRIELCETLAKRMVQMYRHEANDEWNWFESYLTYGNGLLPEALLCAWLLTEKNIYKEIAVSTFNFLLSHTFNENGIEVISNKSWYHKGQVTERFGEQPIDVTYTILALDKFYEALKNDDYLNKMFIAFNWFLGDNHLHNIIYNPCTGGCFDGLEEFQVNLNQGAESAVSYLMARLTVEKHIAFNEHIFVSQPK
jgi:glycosyltransferase involved in cell wall biosynthesis